MKFSNLLKKLIEQDNAQFIKEEQMSTFNATLMKKQIENNQLNSLFPAFSKYIGKKDEDDEEDDQSQGNNFFSGNQYIC